MLTIRHTSGPLAGTESKIEAGVERVVFGRQLDCDVVYPADTTAVGRHHFALVRRESNDWTVDLFGRPYVGINGVAAGQGQLVESGSRFHLGGADGPSFETMIVADAARDGSSSTLAQEKYEPAAAIAGQARIATRATRWIAAAALLLGVAGVGFAVYFHSRSETFAQELAAFRKSTIEAASLRIGRAARARLSTSVYHVVKRNSVTRGETAIGTAWPVGPHEFATTTSVAGQGDKLAKDEVLSVREPGSAAASSRTYDVVGHRIHPASQAFREFINASRVSYLTSGNWYVPSGLSVLGYDVAVLQIKEDIPADAIFPLAGTEELQQLKAGLPVATAGYPGRPTVAGHADEAMSGQMASLGKGVPELRIGTISAISDFFFFPSDPEHNQLVHDDLSMTRGDAGSPVVDGEGRVIAMVSAGNHWTLPEGEGLPAEIPQAAQVNFAQRIDVLKELLDGTSDKAVARDKAYWDRQIGNFTRGVDAEISLLMYRMEKFGEEGPPTAPTVVFDRSLKLTAAERGAKSSGGFQRQASTEVPVVPGETYSFIAYDANHGPLELYVAIANKIVAQNTEAWHPLVKLKIADAKAAALWVVSPKDADVAYVLRAYKWGKPASKNPS